MTALNLPALLAIAKAAMPGHWLHNKELRYVETTQLAKDGTLHGGITWHAHCDYAHDIATSEVQGAYIAALDPTTVLKLLAVVAAAQRWRDCDESDGLACAHHDDLADAVDALKEQP